MRGKGELWADLGLLWVAMIWGSSYALTKQALVFYPVLGFIALRFGITFVLLLPVLLREWREVAPLALPLGVGLLGIFLCEINGVALTSASNAGFLIALFVLFTPFAEWLLLGERPRTQVLAACAVSLLGVWLLCGGIDLHLGLGDALMIAAALLRAGLVCLTRRLCQRRQASALAITAAQSGVVTVGCLVLAQFGGGLPALPGAPAFWAATLFLVLFATLLAFVVQNHALRRASPTRVMLLMGSEPLFGALFAALLLGERLSPLAWLGGLLIVVAALWASLGPLRITDKAIATA